MRGEIAQGYAHHGRLQFPELLRGNDNIGRHRFTCSGRTSLDCWGIAAAICWGIAAAISAAVNVAVNDSRKGMACLFDCHCGNLEIGFARREERRAKLPIE